MMGSGIASMHYIGMTAMRMTAECRYNVRLVALSIVIAVLSSFAALWLAFYFRRNTAGTDWRKLAGAVALGVAIPAMHYTGMAAVHFSPSTAQPALSHAVNISTLGIAGIAAVTFVVLGLALLTSWVDRQFAAHALELQASNERYRLLFERSVAGIYRGTSDARILDCNDAFSRILGYPSRKHLSQSTGDILLTPVDREAFLTALRNQKVLSNFEHCLRPKDDPPVWVLENATLIESSDDAPETIEGTVIDITRRKQAETALQQANNLLEKRNREIEDELILATKVQETLVPKGLVWARGTVETHYQPARSIGGDFGLVTLSSDCLSAMVCDVSGHGIGSALVANRVYTEIIDLVQRGSEFAPMLQQLNSFVLQSFAGEFYFTLAAVRLNGDGHTLTFAGAGHPPAMIARPGEQPRLLQSQSRALGLLEEAISSNATTQVRLQAGDRVVIYTDGFSECFNTQEQELGIDGLSRIVEEASERPLTEMKRAILDGIDAWQNGPPADDRSLIVVGVH
jgi:sigma-B regulation protein RsbU (phosphoserine phosphatase)